MSVNATHYYLMYDVQQGKWAIIHRALLGEEGPQVGFDENILWLPLNCLSIASPNTCG